MIYIVIPVFNRWHYTKSCLASLQKQSCSEYKIIVVDHGSTDGTSKSLAACFPEVLSLKGDESMWWTAATNIGVKKALELSMSDCDFVLTLNNDLVVEENYLTELLEVYKRNKPSIIGSISVDINHRDKVYYAGTLWNKITAKYKSSITLNLSLKEVQEKFNSIKTDLLPGRGVLIPIKCFKEVGVYDQDIFPHYMADEEFSLRCRKSGYKLLVASKAVVYSYVYETGLKQQKKLSDIPYWKAFFTSIKSPNSIRNRWNWATKTTPFPLIYFIFDFTRILYSQLRIK